MNWTAYSTRPPFFYYFDILFITESWFVGGFHGARLVRSHTSHRREHQVAREHYVGTKIPVVDNIEVSKTSTNSILHWKLNFLPFISSCLSLVALYKNHHIHGIILWSHFLIKLHVLGHKFALVVLISYVWWCK